MVPCIYRRARISGSGEGRDDDGLGGYATRSVKATGEPVDSQALRRLLDRLMMVSGDYRDPATFTALARRLSQAGTAHPVHYLAVPPDLFATVIEGLAAAGLHRGARVLVEKPFGRNLASARRLNRALYRSFPETAIFRIDHFLAKETVENLFAFRFANSFLEPIWNRHYLANIQITLAEDFGVAGRGGFYDSVGAIRDVVQNHLLQVVTMLAMEPPADATAEALRDEKVKVVKAMPAVRQDQLVRGQYQHYRDEAGVASDSTTDTYAALRLQIDSWRWAGVPFLIRAGKALPTTALEAVAELKPPPRMLFAETHTPQPNLIRLRLGDGAGVTMTVQVKRPEPTIDTRPVDLEVDFSETLGRGQQAYEKLLADAIDGAPDRFAREDMIEHAWRVVGPALDSGPVHPYPQGTWGPAAANRLPGSHGWHNPVTP